MTVSFVHKYLKPNNEKCLNSYRLKYIVHNIQIGWCSTVYIILGLITFDLMTLEDQVHGERGASA